MLRRLGRSIARATKHLRCRYKGDLTKGTGHLRSAREANALTTPKLRYLAPKPSSQEPQPTKIKVSHSHIALKDGSSLVNLQLDSISPMEAKPAIYVACLDVSGSMYDPCSTDTECSAFNRLDLVKHSAMLLIKCLRPQDQLALVIFNNTGHVLMPLTRMDAAGKAAAMASLEKIRCGGMTSIWGGVDTSLGQLDAVPDDWRVNISTLILTDGISNSDPAIGIVNSFIERTGRKHLHSCVSVFGYGYELDSKTLLGIATIGGGVFVHIPDYGMVHTSFVNYISYTMATNVLKCRFKADALGADIDIGFMQHGQPRNILYRPNNARDSIILTHQGGTRTEYQYDIYDVDHDTKIVSASTPQDDIFKMSNLDIHHYRDLLIGIITNGVSGDVMTTDVLTVRKQLDTLVASAEERANAGDTGGLLRKLIKNIKDPSPNHGQVCKAFSRDDWYQRWGQHYLRALCRAHRLSVCTNFKDSSLEDYGGELFREIRREVEDIFTNIPPPEPSLKQTFTGNYQQRFYSSTEPCIDGAGQVRLANGAQKRVDALRKGDIITNSDGNIAEIVCVIKTAIKSGAANMIAINGMKITPWHPIRAIGGWVHPNDIGTPYKFQCDYVYNFVLDKHHIMTVSGVDIITLGHGYTTGILKHELFGTNKIIDILKTCKGWDEGYVVIEDYLETLSDKAVFLSTEAVARAVRTNRDQEELVADLVIKGHTCAVIKESYPIQVQWCGKTPCAKSNH